MGEQGLGWSAGAWGTAREMDQEREEKWDKEGKGWENTYLLGGIPTIIAWPSPRSAGVVCFSVSRQHYLLLICCLHVFGHL